MRNYTEKIIIKAESRDTKFYVQEIELPILNRVAREVLPTMKVMLGERSHRHEGVSHKNAREKRTPDRGNHK